MSENPSDRVVGLNAALELIQRSGGPEAVWLTDLRKAIDGLMDFLGTSLCHEAIELPRGWHITFQSVGGLSWGWCLVNQTRNRFTRLLGPSDGMPSNSNREDVLFLADDIAGGWLDEVGEFLALRRSATVKALSAIAEFVE